MLDYTEMLSTFVNPFPLNYVNKGCCMNTHKKNLISFNFEKGKAQQEPKRRRRYTPEQLQADVTEGKVERSLREVARVFGIPHTTLQDYK